jgi:DNA-binding MarR family transcriptional regulator
MYLPIQLHEDAQRVLDHLRRIVRVLRESSRAAEQAVGLSGAQLFVLQTLAADGRLSLNQVAARARTHQSTVSGVVKKLAARRLVHRAASRTDGRRVELTLSARGRALLGRAPGAAQERLIDGIDRMPPTERTRLARALERLVDAMGLGDESPRMFFEDEAPARRKGVRRVAR